MKLWFPETDYYGDILKIWKTRQQNKSLIPGKKHNAMYFSGLEISSGQDNRLGACQMLAQA